MAKPVKKPFSMRLTDEVRAALEAKAKAKGISESDLARIYISEKLLEQDSGRLAEIERKLDQLLREQRFLTALSIAADSQTFDLDDAKELVQQHLESGETVTS